MNKTKKLPLSRGQFALVDAEDYGRFAKYHWCYAKNSQDGVSVARYKIGGNCILLSREITSCPKNKIVIPINGNLLDCRKVNLLVASRSHSIQHARPLTNKTSVFKGVHWRKVSKKWVSHIQKNGKQYHLGCFKIEEEAAIAYDSKAVELYGATAFQNFNNHLVAKKSFLSLSPPTSIYAQRPHYNSSSKLKGVSRSIGRGKPWTAVIRYNKKCYYLGCFNTAIDAARAYDSKAKELFGESAYLNFA